MLHEEIFFSNFEIGGQVGLQHTITFLRPLVCKCIQVHILAELFSAWSMGIFLFWNGDGDGDGGVLLHYRKAFFYYPRPSYRSEKQKWQNKN